MKRNILWIFAIAVCFAQAVFAQAPVSSPISPRGYLVGPGDVIEGKVLGEKDFDFTATIDEDGNFEVPFFDKPVPATCKTEKELRAEVTRLVSKYVRNPQVSVQVKERKSRPPATIYGEVRQQQQVILTRQARLLELISFAGGETEKASGMIQIFRTQPPLCAAPDEVKDWKTQADGGFDVPSRVYTLASLRQGREEANPIIYPGDIIVVQKARSVFIVGEVNAVGEFPITEGGLPLSEAIARAGGVRREAKTKNVTIRRLKANSKDREIISVNYDSIKKGQQKDVMLEPYDIVEVDKSKKSIGEVLLGLAMRGAETVTTSVPVRIF
ncbi:MAG: SLBB domain-containing protein [Acidobacteriota bacterium]|nr:SLBB domain-containing protein [Acidobacteriota bacterium]